MDTVRSNAHKTFNVIYTDPHHQRMHEGYYYKPAETWQYMENPMAPIAHNSTPAKVARPSSAYQGKRSSNNKNIVSNKVVRNLNSR